MGGQTDRRMKINSCNALNQICPQETDSQKYMDRQTHRHRQKGSQPVDRQVVNVIYKDSQGLATAYSRAPGDTAAICLSFVSSYKTQSALHVICQRAAHSDRYRVREDPRY